MTEDETWDELERKQLKKTENKMKNKDIMFSHWYDSLEGTKSQGFAYKAWCAGWDASKVVEREKCAADYLDDCARAVEAARLEERERIAKLCDGARAARLAELIRGRTE